MSNKRGKVVGECEECGEKFYSNGDEVGTPCKCGALMCGEHIKELAVALEAYTFDDGSEKPKKTMIKVFEGAGYDLFETFLCPFCYYGEILEVLEKIKDKDILLKCFKEMLSDPDFFEDEFLEQFIWPEGGKAIFDFGEEVIERQIKKYKRFKYTPK
jgi:hypothetical protein